MHASIAAIQACNGNLCVVVAVAAPSCIHHGDCVTGSLPSIRAVVQTPDNGGMADDGTDQPALHLESHQEILNLVSWIAFLTQTVPCCKRTFDDLVERLVQTGPFFANLAKFNPDFLVKAVGTNLEGVAASLRPVLELLEVCRAPEFQIHLLLQQEDIVNRAALLGNKVGSKIEELINELNNNEVEIEHKTLKRAINAAYQLQHVLYAIDDTDRASYDKLKSKVEKRQPNSDSNASSSEVSYINGEPVELLPAMLAKQAGSDPTANYRYITDNPDLKSICEKVAKGDLDFSDVDYLEGSKLNAPRKSRISIAGVWTRPQPLNLDKIVASPRVLWEVDTPTEFSFDDESLDSFRFDVERDFSESVSKGSKGKLGADFNSDKGPSKAQDPPPPKIQDVTEDPTALGALPYSRTTRRISFLPGQEGGERRESYLEGLQSPVQKCRRQSRRSYLAAGEDAPWEYLCPISRELMVDPVSISTGQTYDRAMISRWINDGHYTCPVTGLQITSTDLLPNYALRHAIGRWADDHNIKLPEAVSVPILAEKKLTPTQRLLEWGQCLPNPTAPVYLAVGRLYRGNSKEQEAALKELCEFAKDGGEDGRYNVAEVGAIPALIDQMQNGTLLARELAAKCVRFLCRSTNVMITQAASGAIPSLVTLLHEGTPDACEAAAGALVNLSAKNEVNKLCIAAAGAIPWLIRMLDGKAMFSSFTTQEIAAAALCNLAVNEWNRVEIAKEGAIPKLIQVVSDCPTPEAGEYACHALGSLSSENFENSSLMIQAGAAEVLVAMAGPGTPWTQEAAARAIRNISFNESLRQPLVDAGAIQQLNALLEYSTPRAADAAAAALWNLVPGGPKYLKDNVMDEKQTRYSVVTNLLNDEEKRKKEQEENSDGVGKEKDNEAKV